MKASETQLIKLLDGTRQFVIPIYQRSYSWTERQCEQLFDDVVRVATNGDLQAHFIGSVVYVERGLYQAAAVPELLVIDGQQRLTTCSLLVEALAREAALRDGAPPSVVTPRKLRNKFLFNADEDGEHRFKLILSQADNTTLRALIEERSLPDDASPRVVENFEYFRKRIRDCGLSLDQIYEGIGKLLVVSVALDRQNDNPQLIFESLNSTGLALNQADLVRNYVLMGLEPVTQEELYTQSWRPMERALDSGDGKTFDRFLRAWLAMELGDMPALADGYEEFKRLRSSDSERSVAEVVRELHRHAGHYARIVLGTEEDPRLARVWNALKAIRIDAPLPLLLHLLDQNHHQKLGAEELLGCVELIESWLVRRMVCEIASNVLSRTFPSMPGYLEEGAILDSLAAWLANRAGAQRFPSDEEFLHALVGRDLYHMKACNYFLVRLENHGRKEPIEIGQYTIEHVLPQNPELPEAWRSMLGDDWESVQGRWVHTIGNLTLTGYNPELSDRPFEEKRTMEGGFADSPLRLNRGLATTDQWNERAIDTRGRSLAETAMSVWGSPEPSVEMRERFRAALPKRVRHRSGDGGDSLRLEGDHLQFYEALREGLESLGFTVLPQKTQYSFQLPGWKYRPVIACWLNAGTFRVQLRDELAVAESMPPGFNAYQTGSRAHRVQIDVTSMGDVETIVRFVHAVHGEGTPTDSLADA